MALGKGAPRKPCFMHTSTSRSSGPLSITRRKATEADLLAYAKAFRDRCADWYNFLGEPVYMALMEGEGAVSRDYPPFSPFAEEANAAELLKDLAQAQVADFVPILRQYMALPDQLYTFCRPGIGHTYAEPIYTGLVEVSLEGSGSVIAEAFLGAEVHVLDASGHLIHRDVRSAPIPRLGVGESFFTDLNSDYDTQVKGRYDERYVRISDYNQQPLADFTVQYNTFPFLDGRDEWCLYPDRTTREGRMATHLDNWRKEGYLEEVLHRRPLDFPFLPTEVRSDPGWATRFSELHPVNFLSVSEDLRNDKDFVVQLISHKRKVIHPSSGLARELADPIKVYPYLPCHLRRDMDILRSMHAADLLFDLPWPDDCTPEQCDDIRGFIDSNADRILDVLELFPNALHFGPTILDRLPQPYTDDTDVMLKLVGAHWDALPRASPRLLKDRDFLLQAVRLNPRCIDVLPGSVRSDASLMRELEAAARASEDELPF
jgi:hypothetical protein